MSEKIVQLDLFSEKDLTPLQKAQKGIRGLFVRHSPLQNAVDRFKKDIIEIEALLEQISLAEKEPRAISHE